MWICRIGPRRAQPQATNMKCKKTNLKLGSTQLSTGVVTVEPLSLYQGLIADMLRQRPAHSKGVVLDVLVKVSRLAASLPIARLEELIVIVLDLVVARACGHILLDHARAGSS
jgi:hypothetical protein